MPHASTRSRSFVSRARRFAAAAAALACAGGCAVGPDYKRPATAAPAAFKESAGWRAAQSVEIGTRAPWWQVFDDPVLDAIEVQANRSNLTIAQAAANYEQARQLARSDRTGFLPTVSAVGSLTRSKSPSSKSSGSIGAVSLYDGALQASWEPDFWGKVRRTTEASAATAQASAAEFAAARLSVQSALAQDYLQLRIADGRKQLITDAVAAYRRTLEISTNRYDAGLTAKSDLISARTQLDNARAQLIDIDVLRSRLEHAIAVLLGKLPSDFSVASRPGPAPAVPEAPLALPSDMLERRPDIAQAEREVAAANARVGIQTSARFPSVSLTGSAGYEGSPLNKLFSAPFRFWSLGADVSDALLDWGQRRDQVLVAKAAYEAGVANYRQTVLDAFQQVEDNLAELRILGEEEGIQRLAVDEAADAARIALNEYNAGTVDYTTVATAQVAELNSRETLLGIEQSRLISSVALIAALGGGWSPAELPGSRELYAARASSPAAVQ